MGPYLSPEAYMMCVICKHGETRPGTTRIAVDRLQQMLAADAQGGVQVEVREYIAA
jgi:hypothetical protein